MAHIPVTFLLRKPLLMLSFLFSPEFLTLLLIVGSIFAIVAFGFFRIIPGQENAVVEMLGRPLQHVWKPGFHLFMPGIMHIRARIDLRQRTIERESQCKTRDNVFVVIKWVVRFQIIDAFKFVYANDKPIENLLWQVENDIRKQVSGIDLDGLYTTQSDLAETVIMDMDKVLSGTGVKVQTIMLEQPIPPANVQQAMNRVVEAENVRKAAQSLADAKQIELVGVARAEKESKKLQGEGIAAQREAIAKGLEHSFKTMQTGMPSVKSTALVELLKLAMNNDMIVTATQSGRATLMVVPHNYESSAASAASLALAGKLTEENITNPS